MLSFSAYASTAEKETYILKKMWPKFEQPWYFHKPGDIAVSTDNKAIYVADTMNHRIHKYLINGTYVWTARKYKGTYLNQPNSIAVDQFENIYAVDSQNSRIVKYSSHGSELDWQKIELPDSYPVFRPAGIAVSSNDKVYILDQNSGCLFQTDTDGNQLSELPGIHIQNYTKITPQGLDVYTDKEVWIDYIYLAGTKIKKNEIFVNVYTEQGEKKSSVNCSKEQFGQIKGIAVNKKNIYISTDPEPGKLCIYKNIQSYQPDNRCIYEDSWGKKGLHHENIRLPAGIDIADNKVYVTDKESNSIKYFSDKGNIIRQFGSSFASEGYFNMPDGIAIDHSGNIFVADTNNGRVQQFDENGKFQDEWKNESDSFSPTRIGINLKNEIYVTDEKNGTISILSDDNIIPWNCKYPLKEPYDIDFDNNDHVFIASKGTPGIIMCQSNGTACTVLNCNGRLKSPNGLTVLNDKASLLVADYTPGGQIYEISISNGSCQTFFYQENKSPYEVEVDQNGFVYVVVPDDNLIYKLDSNGNIINTISEPSGYKALSKPSDCAISLNGDVYVVDYGNNRIQVYQKSKIEDFKDIAIIVMGGGPYSENKIWSATHICGTFAHRTLGDIGFTPGKTLLMLTPAPDLLDDEPGVITATISNLSDTLKNIDKKTHNLFLYFVDHGGYETFMLNENETLKAYSLNTLLNEVSVTGKIILLYDACKGKSFTDLIKGPNDNRIVISSTQGNAYLLYDGKLSFSFQFFRNLLNGYSFQDSFTIAKKRTESITNNLQVAEMNPDNVDITIGNIDTGMLNPPPVISVLSHNSWLKVSVYDNDGISDVRAFIIPPDFENLEKNLTIFNFRQIELEQSESDPDIYETKYTNPAKLSQTHKIFFMAEDKLSTSSISDTVEIELNENKGLKKAIFIMGKDISFIQNKNIDIAINALDYQGYSYSDIILFSAEFLDSYEQIEQPPLTSDNLMNTIRSFSIPELKELIIFISGKSIDQKLYFGDNDYLKITDLNSALNFIQEDMKGEVILFNESEISDSFLLTLTNENRTIITTTSSYSPLCQQIDLRSNCLSKSWQKFFSDESTFGYNSCNVFSRVFWYGIWSGNNLNVSFRHANEAVLKCNDQLKGTIQIESNNNGIGNENDDFECSEKITIGSGNRIEPALILEVLEGFICSKKNSTPIKNAKIEINGNIEVSTSNQGLFHVRVAPGVLYVKITAAGHQTEYTQLYLHEAQTRKLYFELTEGDFPEPKPVTSNNAIKPDDDIKSINCFIDCVFHKTTGK